MNIIYGIASEGMGHAIRSKPTIEFLSQDHNVLVLSGGKVHQLYSKYFDTFEIPFFTIEYINGRASKPRTVFEGVRKLQEVISKRKEIANRVSEFSPDIFVTDFEPITAYTAKISGKPLISIDHLHCLSFIAPVSLNRIADHLTNRAINSFFIPNADHYFISSFFQLQTKSKKVSLVSPILRDKIYQTTPTQGEHVLVYLSTPHNGNLNHSNYLNALRTISKRVNIYGARETHQSGNLTFKPFGEKEFVEDLASCKAFICNGGFTAISEALFFRKPIYSVPLKNHYEQFVNAQMLARAGYGMTSQDIRYDSLNHFLINLDRFSSALKAYKPKPREEFFNLLERKIIELT